MASESSHIKEGHRCICVVPPHAVNISSPVNTINLGITLRIDEKTLNNEFSV